MATLGSLVANVVANTAPFERGMKRASSSLDRFSKKSTSSRGSLAALAAKFAKLAAAASLVIPIVRRLSRSMRELNALAVEARSLDMTSQSLRALQYSAGLAGIEAGSLNAAMSRMNTSITQAAHGTGEAVEPLKHLGLEARKLATMSPGQQFDTLAAAFDKIASPAEKARLATALFGDAGRDMLAVLNEGQAGLEKQSEEFKLLAGNISELDMEKVTNMKNEWKKVGIVWKATWDNALVAIEPLGTALAKIFKWTGWGLSMLMKYNPFFVVFNLHRDRQNRLMKETKKTQKELLPTFEEERKKQEALAKAQAERIKLQEKLHAQRKREGEAIRRQFLTPQEKLQERVADLNRLVNAGAISWQTYDRALAGAVKNMRESNRQQDQIASRQGIAAVKRGTTAAYSAEQSTRRAMQGMKKAQQRQLEEQQKTNRILKQIKDNNLGGKNDLKVVNL